MNCPNCGTFNREDGKFCRQCGSNLAAPAALPTPPAPSQAKSPTSGVVCPTCQMQNRFGAKNCRYCGGPLSRTRKCPFCGTDNRIGARFCSKCAKPLLAQASPRLGTGNLAPRTLVKDRYLTVGKIAQGGMGAVYRVTDTHLDDPARQLAKTWALKEMSESAFQPDQMQEAIQNFRHEATLLAHLRHPNLPEVHDLFEYQGKYYLVMDFIEGRTLEQILAASPAPLELGLVLKWANQLCGVLEYLHDQRPPIIYRDLKPSNIMHEEETGLLKIIDFGIARFQKKRTSRNLLQTGQSMDDAGEGTMGYAPPEQWQKGNVTTQADVYALGVVLYQLLTKHEPSGTPFSLPPLRQMNPAVSQAIADVIAKAHANNMAERYQTIVDFQRDLTRVWIKTYGGWKIPSGGSTP